LTTLIFIQIIVSFLLQYWTSIPMMGGVKTQVLKPETNILHIFVPFGLFFSQMGWAKNLKIKCCLQFVNSKILVIWEYFFIFQPIRNCFLLWISIVCLFNGVLTPFSTMFQLYHGGQFYWWRKTEDSEKTTDLTNSLDIKSY